MQHDVHATPLGSAIRRSRHFRAGCSPTYLSGVNISTLQCTLHADSAVSAHSSWARIVDPKMMRTIIVVDGT